ncbi:restriction endonuclease subunit S [Vibrio parahaemolyticus]|nr:restriction endonuclease subunit S [Vibrio parahaemolyticus]
MIKSVKLGEVARISSGGTPSRANPSYWNGNIPWVKTTQIQNCVITPKDVDEWITEEGLKNSSAKMVPAGTIVLGMIGQGKTRGQVGYLSFDACTNQNAATITCSNECDSWFIYQYLLFNYENIRALSNSSGQGNLNLGLVEIIPITLPSLLQQKKIAKLLGTWDNAIEKTEALIAAKEKQFEWLCQTYFKPGNSTNSGWEKHKIASFVTVRNEREVPSEEVPLYSLTIENGVTAKTDRYNREFLVIDKGGKKYKVVHPKDIVFNPANLRWGAIARSEVEHKVVLSPIYEVLKVDENKIDSDFLTHALTCSRQIAIFATMVEGTLVERMAVKIDTFLSCHIHVPSSKEEQKNIAHVLNLSKQEISLLKKTLEQYRSQKRGLMQKLLTGEWQVGSSQHLSEETCQELSREGVA